MKPTLLARIAIGSSMAIGAMPGASFADATALVAQASDRFSCNTSQMSTTVQTERGAVSLIRWVDRSFPPPYSPEQRCQIVSERFKNFDNNGTLKYIKADSLNNLPILCMPQYKESADCLPNGLLVTFKPGTNANQKLVQILDRRVWALGGAVQLGSKDSSDNDALISNVDGETYVNMEKLLELSSQKSN